MPKFFVCQKTKRISVFFIFFKISNLIALTPVITPRAACKLTLVPKRPGNFQIVLVSSPTRIVSKRVSNASVPEEVWQTLAAMPELTNPRITEVLPIRGSGRAFYRVSATVNGKESSLMLMSFGANRSDNLKYISTSDYLRELGIRIPTIINREHSDVPPAGSSRTLGYVLTTDLGKTTLKDLSQSPKQRLSYVETLNLLTDLHTHKLSDVPKTLELEAPFDQKLYYDLEQGTLFQGKFLKGFLKLSDEEAQKALPASERQALVDQLLKEKELRLVHRDANAENFMSKDGNIYAIDFQGLRGGLPEYDIASLLFDPYVKFTPQMREMLLGKAHKMLQEKAVIPDNLNYEKWKQERLYPAATQRLMQAMGAYGRLVVEEKQNSYFEPMISARANLLEILKESKQLPSLYNMLLTLNLNSYKP